MYFRTLQGRHQLVLMLLPVLSLLSATSCKQQIKNLFKKKKKCTIACPGFGYTSEIGIFQLSWTINVTFNTIARRH